MITAVLAPLPPAAATGTATLVPANFDAGDELPEATLNGQLTNMDGEALVGETGVVRTDQGQFGFTTDDAGAFSVTGKFHGNVSVSVNGTAFGFEDKSVFVAEGSTTEMSWSIADLPMMKISGVVRNEHEELLPGAAVTSCPFLEISAPAADVPVSGQQTEGDCYTTTASDDGSYELTVPQYSYDVEASHPGYKSHIEVVRYWDADGKGDKVVDFALIRNGETQLSGTVLDAASKQPVAGTTVSVCQGENCVSADVQPDGTYFAESFRAGEVTVTVQADGYETLEKELTIAAGQRLVQNLELVSTADVTGSLTGVVTNATTGEPVAGAVVEACDARSCTVVSTADDGRYNFGRLYAGSVSVKVSMTGYKQNSVTAAVRERTETMLDILLTYDAQLSGRIFDRDSGQGISGVDIEYCRGSECQKTTTNAQGEYQAPFTEPGWYEIRAHHPQYVTEKGFAEIRRRTRVTRDIELVRRTVLSGRVVASDQKSPVPGVLLKACDDKRCHKTRTETNGEYTFEEIRHGEVKVQGKAEKFPYFDETIELPAGKASHTFVLAEPVTVTGTVRSEKANQPLANALIKVCSIRYCKGTRTKADGSYSTILPGNDRLNISAYANGFPRQGKSFAAPLSPRIEVNFTLTYGEEMTGRVIDANTGKPIPGASIYLCAEPPPHRTVADENGHFSLRTFRSDVGTIASLGASKEGYVPNGQTVIFTPGKDTHFNVYLHQVPPAPEGLIVNGEIAQSGLVESARGRPTVMEVTGCEGGSVTYSGKPLSSSTRPTLTGSFSEQTAGKWVAELPRFRSAYRFTITKECPGSPPETMEVFVRYIDPSGNVFDTEGNPIKGATVVLEHSESEDGPFYPVPDGSELMSPDNRKNPWVTPEDGSFRWDVAEGFYRLQVSAPGYTVPGSDQTVLTTEAWKIPPEVVGLRLVLEKQGTDDGHTPTVEVTGGSDALRVGEQGTVVANVTGDHGAPTGTVSFTVGGAAIDECQSVPVGADGAARCDVEPTAAGASIVNATYNGDDTYSGASGTWETTVAKGIQRLHVGELSSLASKDTTLVQVTSNAPDGVPSATSNTSWSCDVTGEAGQFAVTGKFLGVCRMTFTAPETANWEAAEPVVAGMGVAPGWYRGPVVSGFTETKSGEPMSQVSSAPLTSSESPVRLVATVTATDGPDGPVQVADLSGGGLVWKRQKEFSVAGTTTSVWVATTDQPVADLVVTADLSGTAASSVVTLTSLGNNG